MKCPIERHIGKTAKARTFVESKCNQHGIQSDKSIRTFTRAVRQRRGDFHTVKRCPKRCKSARIKYESLDGTFAFDIV